MVRVEIVVVIPGVGEVKWLSEPMSEVWASIVLWELSNGPFRVERAKLVRDA